MTEALRTGAARIAAVLVVLIAFGIAREPSFSAEERVRIARDFAFERLPLRSASTAPRRTERTVQPQLRRIRGWISAVGAAVALADLDGDGLPNDACLVDPRTDSVTVTPAPGTPTRFEPFLVDAAPLPYHALTMAPTGCLPGDFDEDGTTDLLVTYWGRTPVFFLRRAGRAPGPGAFARRELVTSRERWYTDSVLATDLDGDGHADLVIGNYFPDGARVLDARAEDDPNMEMPDSLSRAVNGGRNRIFLHAGEPAPGVARYREQSRALRDQVAGGWTLASGAADLNGDLLPELYFANDFGPDRLLVNRSTRGRVRLTEVEGRRTLGQPASKVLGRDSFKGMGIDFGDLNDDGRLDMIVSNITAEFALQESNLAFVRTGEPLAAGEPAPFDDRSESLGLARSGWAWDVKFGDFDNDSVSEIVQATGFLKGSHSRWPELHELAMGNDELVRHPGSWPRFHGDDDLSGHQRNPFFVRAANGRYADVSREVGLGGTPVTRALATADVNGDGRLDLAMANQWEDSHLYLNRSPQAGAVLGLKLVRAGTAGTVTRVLPYPDRRLRAVPATGASATVTLPGGRRMTAQVDGGNGHGGVRAPELLYGLGARAPASLAVELAWRDSAGHPRHHRLSVRPGMHTIVLGEGP